MESIAHIDRKRFYFDASGGIKGGGTKRHYHEMHELYFLEHGACDYFIEGHRYTLRSGDLIWIPAGKIHQTEYKKSAHARRLINCSTDWIPEELRPLFLTAHYLWRDEALSSQIAQLLCFVERESRMQEEYCTRLLECYVAQMLFLLARNKEAQLDLLTNNKTAEAAISYINRNYMSEITLRQVAQASAVSAEHLSRVFRRETGMGVNEYVNLLRLRRAERMLRNEEGRSVAEIAFCCGFNDSNYFSYRFKETFGQSPTAYRKHVKTSES